MSEFVHIISAPMANIPDHEAPGQALWRGSGQVFDGKTRWFQALVRLVENLKFNGLV